ncbi:ATP-binding protein [Rickettsia sp. TH2014]|uniref:ATP-binding protein n=1 Tax=Rickettsia sp. TH2014 TaxID=1967503 RepID=UPI001C445790|nr:ATP-binding protein [Rickettsia sp. TH2014]
MINRHITSFVKQSLKDFSAVLIIGARQVGKSTVVKQLYDEGIFKSYITLDDISQLEAATADPHGFIKNAISPLAIDGIQRAPDLLKAIKKSTDEDKRPGRFLLTGSANIFSYPGVYESLAGRVDVIHLEGLSLGEILNQNKPSSFILDIFSGVTIPELKNKWTKELEYKPTITNQSLNEYIFYGGFPEVILKKQERFRERWFSSYQSAYIERDVRNINKFLDVVSFAKLFRLVGLQSGNLLNQKNLSIEIGLDQRTISRYLEILETTFQVNQLAPWFSNTRKRLVKTSKIYMNDSGYASYLNGITTPNLLLNSPYYGTIFETWLWAELRKILTLTTGIEQAFYRTHLGKEVDFLLYKGDVFCGIECKATETIQSWHFMGLKDLSEALAPRIMHGIILYNGNEIISFSDKFLALPLKCII